MTEPFVRPDVRRFLDYLNAPPARAATMSAPGNIHGFINLRKAIPSTEEDIRGCVEVLKLMIREAGER